MSRSEQAWSLLAMLPSADEEGEKLEYGKKWWGAGRVAVMAKEERDSRRARRLHLRGVPPLDPCRQELAVHATPDPYRPELVGHTPLDLH
ncbi:hypothetical protein [Oryza sativa Japonica Group]|uniref:Uncharacterized protein P0046E05.7 n=1 Tax=Oryza sativa subsp. japonica TaxID=39947 RepID=Q5JN61_ORYSJ|nr:hypothetical protein [Oryza sativa Japonica Group]